MYRIFILSLLAIVSSTFALEPSQIILRATDIRSDSMTLEWSPIAGAKTYKVSYDEESILNPKMPEPILESPATDATKIVIEKMMEGTGYYLIVRGFDENDVKVGETLPLHATVLRDPLFVLKDTEIQDDQNIILTFSQPLDLKNSQIEIVNTETKKPRTFKKITLSPDDLRKVYIELEGKLAPNMSHDIVLKKVTNISGTVMPVESKKVSTLIFSPLTEVKVPNPTIEKSAGEQAIPEIIGEKTVSQKDIPSVEEEKKIETPPVIVETPESDPNITKELSPEVSPDIALAELKKQTEQLNIEHKDISIPGEPEEVSKTPVVIDKLPQTGASVYIVMMIALALGCIFSQKKRRTSF